MYSCRGICKRQDLKFEEMKKERTLNVNFRGICKTCHSHYNKRNLQQNRAEKNPAHYLHCSDCNRLFKQFLSGPALKNGQKRFRDECPFCQGEVLTKPTVQQLEKMKGGIK
jgi:hypothetical protein